MLFRLCTSSSTCCCSQCCGLNKQLVKLLNKRTDDFWFCPDCAKPALNAILDDLCQSYFATVEPRLKNLENSNKLVLDKVKKIQQLSLMTLLKKITPD